MLADIIKSSINMAAYNKLNGEWEELSNLFFEVKTNVDAWGCLPAFGRELGQIEATLVALQEAIGIEAGKTALTENSTFESVWSKVYDSELNPEFGGVTYTLEDRLQTVGAQSAAMQTEYLMEESQKAYLATHKALAGKFYVNGAALKAAFKALVNDWDKAVNGYAVEDEDGEYNWIEGCENYLNLETAQFSNYKKYLGWIETFNNIIAESKTIVENAQGQEYTPATL